jgi:hypothetical protein
MSRSFVAQVELDALLPAPRTATPVARKGFRQRLDVRLRRGSRRRLTVRSDNVFDNRRHEVSFKGAPWSDPLLGGRCGERRLGRQRSMR